MNSLARSIASPNIPAATASLARTLPRCCRRRLPPSRSATSPNHFARVMGTEANEPKNSGISFPPDRRAVTCTASMTACERRLPSKRSESRSRLPAALPSISSGPNQRRAIPPLDDLPEDRFRPRSDGFGTIHIGLQTTYHKPLTLDSTHDERIAKMVWGALSFSQV